MGGKAMKSDRQMPDYRPGSAAARKHGQLLHLQDAGKMPGAKFAHRIIDCARCGGRHRSIVFRRFTRPLQREKRWTHWALCPRNGEPILMKIV